MGDMWRSQKMQLVQMIVQNDAAHAVVNKLGETGIVEFRDVSRRPFSESSSLSQPLPLRGLYCSRWRGRAELPGQASSAVIAAGALQPPDSNAPHGCPTRQSEGPD
jgi:hypothetical protein